MLPEIALSAALTLGATTTAQTEMPFTMYFASAPEIVAQDVVEDMKYDPRQQLTTIDGSVLVAGNTTSTSSKECACSDSSLMKSTDYDQDSQQDDTD